MILKEPGHNFQIWMQELKDHKGHEVNDMDSVNLISLPQRNSDEPMENNEVDSENENDNSPIQDSEEEGDSNNELYKVYDTLETHRRDDTNPNTNIETLYTNNLVMDGHIPSKYSSGNTSW